MLCQLQTAVCLREDYLCAVPEAINPGGRSHVLPDGMHRCQLGGLAGVDSHCSGHRQFLDAAGWMIMIWVTWMAPGLAPRGR